MRRYPAVPLSLLCAVLSGIAPASPAESQERAGGDHPFLVTSLNRPEPSNFARYPEDVQLLLEHAGGYYGQINIGAVYQNASESRTDRDDLGNYMWDLSGAWAPADNAYLSWWVRGGSTIDAPTKENLSNNLGSVLDVNATLEDQDLYLRELYWAHGPNTRFRYSFGWTDASYRYDFNAYANDDHSRFLSASLVNSPAIPFPNSGIAADALWDLGAADLHGGIYQSNCDKASFKCLDDLESAEVFVPVELRLEHSLIDGQRGNYRFMTFYTHTEDREGTGASMSFDQSLGQFGLFLRLTQTDRAVTEIRRSVSLGVHWSSPFERPHDTIGFGWVQGEPADAGKRREQIYEVYWRWQVHPLLSVTPDLQWVVNPANNPEADSALVAGLRVIMNL